MNGYFSLIQLCPNKEREETANVGLVLQCSKIQFLDVRIKDNHQRVSEFFDIHGQDLLNLQQYEEGLIDLILRNKEELMSFEGFNHFSQCRANDLRLTRPTSVPVRDPDRTFEFIFSTLVEIPE